MCKRLSFIARFSAVVLVAVAFRLRWLLSGKKHHCFDHDIAAELRAPTSGTAQFSALGTFGNNSTGDVTTQVTWSSSNPSIATINSSGTATAASSLSSGTKLATTTIIAKSASVTSNSAALTVATVHTPKVLRSVREPRPQPRGRKSSSRLRQRWPTAHLASVSPT